MTATSCPVYLSKCRPHKNIQKHWQLPQVIAQAQGHTNTIWSQPWLQSHAPSHPVYVCLSKCWPHKISKCTCNCNCPKSINSLRPYNMVAAMTAVTFTKQLYTTSIQCPVQHLWHAKTLLIWSPPLSLFHPPVWDSLLQFGAMLLQNLQ